MKIQTFTFTQTVLIALMSVCSFLGFTQPAQAAVAPTIVLTVTNTDGTNVTNIVNGQSVVLGWYVNGPLTSCTITEKSIFGDKIVVTIGTAVMPASGTQTVTPPADSNTNYVLNCDQLVESVPINTNPPTVSMSIAQGTSLQTNNVTGIVNQVDVNWSSQNANRCSLVWREKSSAPGINIVETNTWNEYWGAYQVGGTVRYDGDPRAIRETNTFYVTCYNDNTGEEATASITLNVTDAPPPSPPVVNLWSANFPSVTRSELYGFAYVNVGFNSANVTNCTQKAYYANGTQYTNPPNWGTGWWNLSQNFTNIQIATTTKFEVTCSRPAVTLNGIIYPATSTTKSLTIEVLMPGGVTGTMDTWDRTTLPPVTATISAAPNPTVKNSLTGMAGTNVTVTRANASYCYTRAYYINGTPSNYGDDIEYGLQGWTRDQAYNRLSGDGTSSFSFSLSTTTRLSIDCSREFDKLNGTPGNGWYQVSSVVVEVQESLVAVLPPKLYLYGNATIYDANRIYANRTQWIGFNNLTAVGPSIENTASGPTANKVSFPFVHPFGASDTYNIHLKVCDENDGQSTFRVYTQSAGLVGQYTTNDPNSPSPFCGDSYGTIVNKQVATGVGINNGDIITIECDTPDDGERCNLGSVFFGASGTVVTPQVNPIVTSQNESLLWLSENTTHCGGPGSSGHWAVKINGSSYSWWDNRINPSFTTSGYASGFVTSPVSTTTTFSLTCGRTGDSLTDKKSVQVYVPFSATLSSEILVGSGQCIDDGKFGNFGKNMTAPPGYGPDVNGWCSPLIDLAASSPSVSIAGSTEDKINGTYDNLNVLMVIKNFGPGGLPVDSKVTYKASMTFLPVYGLPTINSLTGIFNGALATPVSLASPTESPTLTRTFSGVPFGTHTVCSRVNLDGSPNFPETTTDTTNNTSCSTVTLPVPKPPMTLTADRKVIRREQTVNLNWSVHTSYPLNCVVRGAGGVSDIFDASSKYPNPGGAYSKTMTSGPLNSTSEFTLQCTEPITKTVFSEIVRVEVTPDYQEI